MIEHVIVMAATPSRSMEVLTRHRPKSMLPILGRPTIARVMDGYYNAGIRRFTVVVGERDGDAAAWLSMHWQSDAKLNFAPQGPQRGTASTLFATRTLIDGPFIIAPCDILIPEEHVLHLASYFETHPGDSAALSLFYAPDEVDQGASVMLDPRQTVAYISEKPSGAHQDFMTALPIYTFTPEVLSYLDRVPVVEDSGERALAGAIQLMIDEGHTVGAQETGWRIRLSDPEDLLTANILLMAKYDTPIVNGTLPQNVEMIPPVYIDEGVIVGSGSKLGPNVYLEKGSVIGADVVLRETLVLGVRVGGGKTIEKEIIYRDRI
jgi:bifunctional UDP-N-acetylglucosamine pyrophosphorylase/glucosamine-1-phosphate N-acetyltransferase